MNLTYIQNNSIKDTCTRVETNTYPKRLTELGMFYQEHSFFYCILCTIKHGIRFKD